MTKPCRYEVNLSRPEVGSKSLWSHHSSLKAAKKSFREAVNNCRGDHSNGSLVELIDIFDGVPITLERAEVHPWP